jgi:hypothetical protein
MAKEESIEKEKNAEENAGEIRVEATDTPEEVLDTLRKGAELKKDLANRLGTLKNILNGIEERAQKTQDISDNKIVNLSLSQVEKSIMLVLEISRDLQQIKDNNCDTNLGKSASNTLEKIVNIYDNVVVKLGK